MSVLRLSHLGCFFSSLNIKLIDGDLYQKAPILFHWSTGHCPRSTVTCQHSFWPAGVQSSSLSKIGFYWVFPPWSPVWISKWRTMVCVPVCWRSASVWIFPWLFIKLSFSSIWGHQAAWRWSRNLDLNNAQQVSFASACWVILYISIDLWV